MKRGITNRILLCHNVALCIFLLTAAHSLALRENSNLSLNIESQDLQKLDKAISLLKQHNFSAAEALSREILDGIEAGHEKDSLQTARVLDVLVRSIVGQKKRIDDETRALIERSVSIREIIFGPEHPEVAESLFSFSSLLWSIGDY